MLTIIDLNYSINPYPYISQELIDAISSTLLNNKRVLIFFNRRGDSNALICKDCSYQVKCENCDICMSVHKYPIKSLICHQCNNTIDIPNFCPVCKWSNLTQVWVWIQKMQDNLITIFKNHKINRLDSDKIKKEWIFIDDINFSDIVISTEVWNTISFDNLGLVVFPFFEVELIAWDYNIEEKLYTNISYNSKRWADVIIQTYTPKNRILKILSEWNYKDFLITTLEERKNFSYPPYTDLVYIWIKNKNKERITDIISKMVNKLFIMNENSDKIINFDKKLFTKKNWEFYQKIIIRWPDLQSFLEPVKLEIIRNREIELEWK